MKNIIVFLTAVLFTVSVSAQTPAPKKTKTAKQSSTKKLASQWFVQKKTKKKLNQLRSSLIIFSVV